MEAIRRRALPTVLALLLAIESVAVVSAAAGGVLAARSSASHPLPAASPRGEVLAEAGTADRAWEPGSGTPAVATASALVTREAVTDLLAARRAQSAALMAANVSAPSSVAPASRTPAAKPSAAATTRAVQPKATKVAAPKAVVYRGRNHLWIPALGINKSVSFFPCTRSAAPANYVYRWGCAGSNNVYLLGHAYGVFKPLHDAYTRGRLKAGMRVYYADASGRVSVYTVRWWRVVAPTTSASWAWAPQSVPSMTLQTCVGANSQYRLMVRLVRVG